MSVLGEIKRRKIFQVAAVYVVVAWLILQVIDVVNEPLRLPEWFATVVILLVAIGFPVTLMMSWAFDVTLGGVVRDERNQATTQRGGRSLEYVLILLLVIAVGWLIYRVEMSPSESSALISEQEPQREILPNSVAVLPLQNLTLDPDNGVYADGMHVEIIGQLSKLRSLTVIARDSVLRYAENRPSMERIATELGAQSVLVGTFQYVNDRIRIAMQLVDPTSGTNMWAEEYQAEFSDIFAVQADIAMSVANALKAEFSEEEQARVEQRPTESPEAYALYLRALPTWLRPISAVHELMDEAIRIDPDFADAYVLKARRYLGALGGVGQGGFDETRTPEELARLAGENLDKALGLDPSLPAAHAALAELRRYERRWDEAQASFEQALGLNPNDVQTLGAYSRLLVGRRNFQEAINVQLRIVELSPLGTTNGYGQLGIIYLRARDAERAANAFRIMVDGGGGPGNNLWLGLAYGVLGNEDAALRQLQLADRLSAAGAGNRLNMLARLAYGYSMLGRDGDVQRLARELGVFGEERPVGIGHWVVIHLALGNHDVAFDWLNRAAEATIADNGFLNLLLTRDNAWQNDVLDTPRFKEVLSRVEM